MLQWRSCKIILCHERVVPKIEIQTSKNLCCISFPQQYQKTAEEQYATKLAEYEERVRKAQEEGILASKPEKEEVKPKKTHVATHKRTSSTKKKKSAKEMAASTSKKSTTKMATGTEKSSHSSSSGVLWA